MAKQTFDGEAVFNVCGRHGLYSERLGGCPECFVAAEQSFVDPGTGEQWRLDQGRAALKFADEGTGPQWPAPMVAKIMAKLETEKAQRVLNGLYSARVAELSADLVNHPPHYTSHPSGIECITITRHMGFNLGNATKYIWRADLKHADGGVEDLEKAVWYLQDEIAKRKSSSAG